MFYFYIQYDMESYRDIKNKIRLKFTTNATKQIHEIFVLKISRKYTNKVYM